MATDSAAATQPGTLPCRRHCGMMADAMAPIRFLLNGEPRTRADVPPGTTVLDYLRTVERLCGTKEGCAEGDCGACTIVIGRAAADRLRYEAVNACLMVLPQLDGAAVITVEGLAAADGTLHPVQ